MRRCAWKSCHCYAQTAFDSRLDLADTEAGEAAVAEFDTSRRRLMELREEVARCCEF